MSNRIAGVDVQISRTGYTGDLGQSFGYRQLAPAVWDALMAPAPISD
jgi:glycine cleavage system aminomethyltransferase T